MAFCGDVAVILVSQQKCLLSNMAASDMCFPPFPQPKEDSASDVFQSWTATESELLPYLTNLLTTTFAFFKYL